MVHNSPSPAQTHPSKKNHPKREMILESFQGYHLISSSLLDSECSFERQSDRGREGEERGGEKQTNVSKHVACPLAKITLYATCSP